MKIGVVSRSFPKRSHLEIATLLQEAGAVSHRAMPDLF